MKLGGGGMIDKSSSTFLWGNVCKNYEVVHKRIPNTSWTMKLGDLSPFSICYIRKAIFDSTNQRILNDL